MSKRNLLVRVLILIVLTALLIPSFSVRLSNEADNKDVVFALNYNNTHMVLNADEFEETLERNKEIGVKTVQIGEETLNSLISAGYVTAIKYNVLLCILNFYSLFLLPVIYSESFFPFLFYSIDFMTD